MSRLPVPAAIATAIAAAAITLSFGAGAADPTRGRGLYELRCLACHAESVHARTKRTARDFEDVRRWVARWNAHLKLAWTLEEIDDVAVHLNTTYYHYSCPPTVCKVISQK